MPAAVIGNLSAKFLIPSRLYRHLAIVLANKSPAAPRTLIRAATDYAGEQPEFALAAGMTGLRGIANGHGYDITGADVLDAYAAVMQAAGAAGVGEAAARADVREMIAGGGSGGPFILRILARQLAN